MIKEEKVVTVDAISHCDMLIDEIDDPQEWKVVDPALDPELLKNI